ncbi:MAG: hypothetical protein CSA49_03675 [Gammaproteobacteria bacterium]|nr:MAG: hypothetical protein CSA49_03675 [Gammaproteobacteria bacterium]
MIDSAVARLSDEQTNERLVKLNPSLNDLPEVLPGATWCRDYRYLLVYRQGVLQLVPANKKQRPLMVDFIAGTTGYRGHQNVRNEMLVKAVLGRDKQTIPTVIDATAGLGRDSYLLAVLGCYVTMLERNPVVGALLSDGLARFKAQDQEGVAKRMTLIKGDARENLQSMTEADVVYLDPMFPKRDKAALVKKEMQIFKEIVGPDTDGDYLLDVAQRIALKRVVVKRPAKAEYLAGVKPTYCLQGKASRFDIYQC